MILVHLKREVIVLCTLKLLIGLFTIAPIQLLLFPSCDSKNCRSKSLCFTPFVSVQYISARLLFCVALSTFFFLLLNQQSLVNSIAKSNKNSLLRKSHNCRYCDSWKSDNYIKSNQERKHEFTPKKQRRQRAIEKIPLIQRNIEEKNTIEQYHNYLSFWVHQYHFCRPYFLL